MTIEDIPMARPDIDDADIAAVERVLRSGMLSQGQFLVAFERAFADYVGVPYATGVSSGTAALMVALNAVGVRPGDEVITVALSFVATANAIVSVGAKPVFVDVRPRDLNMDPAAISAAVTERTRAIAVVHLFGHMADMEAICEVARNHGLPVIEDACEAIGACSRSGMAGSAGDAAAFGFYANKPLTTGEGGMIVSKDDAVIEKCRLLRNQGCIEASAGVPAMVGYSFRLSDLHAALGTTQLERLPQNLRWRREIADRYRDLLSDVFDLQLPIDVGTDGRQSWFTYPVRLSNRLTPQRDQIRSELASAGIDTRDYFAPIHTMPYYRDLLQITSDDAEHGTLPVTEYESRRLVALPLYPGMDAGQIRKVARHVREVIEPRT